MTRSPAKDIKMAVNRLGLRGTRDMVTSYVLRTIFRTESRVLKQRLDEIRRQSVKIAAISYVLARSCPGIAPDRAMLAGLLQDIGAFAVLMEIQNRPEIINNNINTRLAISNLSAVVGVLLLRNWEFDEEIIEVVRSREDWLRDRYPRVDMADIVMIARLHSYIGTPLMSDCPRINEVPAFAKMSAAELTPKSSMKLVEVAQKDILELERLLGA
jgi:HD-like signal output (HDOD) protein